MAFFYQSHMVLFKRGRSFRRLRKAAYLVHPSIQHSLQTNLQILRSSTFIALVALVEWHTIAFETTHTDLLQHFQLPHTDLHRPPGVKRQSEHSTDTFCSWNMPTVSPTFCWDVECLQMAKVVKPTTAAMKHDEDETIPINIWF